MPIDPLRDLAGTLCGHGDLLERIKKTVSLSPAVLRVFTEADAQLVNEILMS